MDELETLLLQYKGLINKLEYIKKNYDNLKDYDNLKKDNISLKKELEKQITENGILRAVNNIEICSLCGGVGGFDDGQGGGRCDVCEGLGFIDRSEIKTLILEKII